MSKIEKALIQESKWDPTYMLKQKKFQVRQESTSALKKQFGLLARPNDEVQLTQEDTEMLLGTLMDLMISPKSL
jgi:hypothetical protein